MRFTRHWLDVGEFLMAFAYAYDWLYDAWTPAQRESIMWSILSLGLGKGLEAFESPIEEGWFSSVRGNWNCVTNGGMIVAALAIFHEDPTALANRILSIAVPNARENCARAVRPDGTWSETPDYWYQASHWYPRP